MTAMRNDFIRTTRAVYATTENEYIPALIFDDAGNVIYYGRSNAPLTEKDGTAQLTIPAGFAEGTYTHECLQRAVKGDCKTDLASGFADVTLTIKNRPTSSFPSPPAADTVLTFRQWVFPER